MVGNLVKFECYRDRYCDRYFDRYIRRRSWLWYIVVFVVFFGNFYYVKLFLIVETGVFIRKIKNIIMIILIYVRGVSLI